MTRNEFTNELSQNFGHPMMNTNQIHTNPQRQTTIGTTMVYLSLARSGGGLLAMTGAIVRAGASHGSMRGAKPANGTGRG